jgi:3-hydroxyisobutyrate dehydrogenase-like beta-hydroxyacid dehydrogenase
MAKDLGYAVKEATQKGLRLQTAASALEIFKRAIEAGHGDEDFSAVTKAFDRK